MDRFRRSIGRNRGGKMIGFSGRLHAARIIVVWGLMLLLCGAGLTACGGGDDEAPAVASEEDADIGKAIRSQAWEAVITRPAQKVRIVGEGDITYQAEGTYVIASVKVTNLGEELQMIPRELLRLRDAQGREYEATQSAVQIAYILPRSMDLLLDSPVDPGEARESVIIYDVPREATGLKMAMEGTEETLDLGF
jgi:hypothetical protein